MSTISAPASAPTQSGSGIAQDTNQDFFAVAPGLLAAARKTLELVREAPENPFRQQNLTNIHLRIQTFAASARTAQLPVATRVSSALEALLKRLNQNAKTVTPSTMHTVSNALLLLEELCRAGVEEKLKDQPPIQILVVEDDPLARRAVLATLQPSFENIESADQGSVGLLMAAQKAYDVIFSDVEMPTLNGFELCNHIRKSGLNQHTPVVFVTNHSGGPSRDRAARSGGTDFIAKPFLPIEVTVKAHTFAWKGRLQKLTGGGAGTSV